jgi:RimJ/RimL family protein N-acetyltransferase
MFDKSNSDLMAALSTIISIDTIVRLFQNWRSIWDNFVSPQDRLLVQRIAVFIFIPIGVFFHELGHALATWQVRGQVLEFQWRIFWGYVISSGNFTPVESWWIALSGNIVSILLGIFGLLIIPFFQKRVFKELFYSFAVAQLVYSLVFYPIFSFTGFQGDWVRIYDFSVQPYAQITLAIHLLLVFSLWQSSKNGWLMQYLKVRSSGTNSKRNNKERVIINIERMVLREFVKSDVDALFQILSLPEVMQFSPTGALSFDMSAAKIQGFIDSYQEYGYGKWAVIHRETGRLIGYCGIAVEEIDGKIENELGYRFDPKFWGQGLGTEAASACLEYAFNTLHLEYLLAIVEPDNIASVRILQKIGMSFIKESLYYDKKVHIYKIIKTNSHQDTP